MEDYHYIKMLDNEIKQGSIYNYFTFKNFSTCSGDNKTNIPLFNFFNNVFILNILDITIFNKLTLQLLFYRLELLINNIIKHSLQSENPTLKNIINLK